MYSVSKTSIISARISRMNRGNMMDDREILGRIRCFRPSMVKSPVSQKPHNITVSPRPYDGSHFSSTPKR